MIVIFKHSKTRILLETLFLIMVFLLPLGIALLWGPYLEAQAYVSLGYARSLVDAHSWLNPVDSQALLRAPLFMLALVVSGILGHSLPQAALILGALGWGCAALVAFILLDWHKHPLAGGVMAILLAASPFLVSTLGLETSWVSVWLLLAILAASSKNWPLQTISLFLILGTHFDVNTLTLAVLLLAFRWWKTRKLPLTLVLVVCIVTLSWWGLGLKGVVAGFTMPHPDLGFWTSLWMDLFKGSEFYIFFLPFIVLGCWELLAPTYKDGTAQINPLGGIFLLLCLLLGVVFNSDPVITIVLYAAVLFLVGLGITYSVRWRLKSGAARLESGQLLLALTIIFMLPLVAAHSLSLIQRYRFRPVEQHKLEQRAGAWLQTHADTDAAVFGSAQSGYFSHLMPVTWQGNSSDPLSLTGPAKALNTVFPEYCISFNSLAWDNFSYIASFQEFYKPIKQFSAPSISTSPVTIWERQFSTASQGKFIPLDVWLPGSIRLIGYKFGPDRVEPGKAVYVTLFFKAYKPVTSALRTVVRIITPTDGTGWAQRDMVTPRSMPVTWWEPGETITEHYVLTTTTEIPVGAHNLDMSVVSADAKSFLPLYQDGSSEPVDRVALGYVVVPWHGEIENATSVMAQFGDRIKLLGVETPEYTAPGESLDVTLHWQALAPPGDNYVVFVHLLDSSGQLVANHDAPPMAGRYPTTAWLPGEMLPDVHTLQLAPQLPPGDYDLYVGMYQWPSVERLPVYDQTGVEQENRVILLQTITVQ
ncbi:MAG: hypothetical protein JW981_10520 [Anaerolineae bacterium]|nr:hypothetical protein [Anaerolineae bacterium]